MAGTLRYNPIGGPAADHACREITMADTLDAYIEAAAAALDLPLDPAWKPAVEANLAVTLGHAATVPDFVLPDEAEPAPIYKA